MKFLDPLTLAKLSHLELRVKYVVEGIVSGLHSSSSKGHSTEFAQHREYAYGDELRHVDWKIFGRSDRFFVKQFQDETNLRAYLLVDASGSMGFASEGHIPKLSYAVYCAASLAYLLLHQKDAVGLGVFDQALRFYLPPHPRLSHLSAVIEKLEQVESGGETQLETVLRDFGRYATRRGLIILISDLLADPSAVLQALKYFRFRHHEVIVLQVLDPEEIQFPYTGENIFRHLEDGKELYADADLLRLEYRKLVKQFLDEYKSGFRQAGIEYYLTTTDIPVETALARCIAKN